MADNSAHAVHQQLPPLVRAAPRAPTNIGLHRALLGLLIFLIALEVPTPGATQPATGGGVVVPGLLNSAG